MITDYSAACGLLGGLRRNSFKEGDLDKLGEKEPESLKDLLKAYLGEDYPSKDEVDSFERALYVSCIKKTVKLLKFLPPEARLVLKTLLSEFDILNLKLLIRQIMLHTDVEAQLFYWGFPYLAFKDTDPYAFKDIDALEQYLKKRPVIRGIFIKALSDLKFHKDIFYFDIRLDREYFNLLKNVSLGLDNNSTSLIQHFIAIRLLTYALRLKFFQGRSLQEIRPIMSAFSSFNDTSFLNASSLEEAISNIEKSHIFIRFKEKLSLNFEEDLESIFYKQFLRKRGVNFFSVYPYLVFYLSQRYFIEKMIFIINSKLN